MRAAASVSASSMSLVFRCSCCRFLTVVREPPAPPWNLLSCVALCAYLRLHIRSAT